jgi:hypothetical protein
VFRSDTYLIGCMDLCSLPLNTFSRDVSCESAFQLVGTYCKWLFLYTAVGSLEACVCLVTEQPGCEVNYLSKKWPENY